MVLIREDLDVAIGSSNCVFLLFDLLELASLMLFNYLLMNIIVNHIGVEIDHPYQVMGMGMQSMWPRSSSIPFQGVGGDGGCPQ